MRRLARRFDAPMRDLQFGRGGCCTFTGEPAGQGEQVGQPEHRRQLRAGIQQDSHLDVTVGAHLSVQPSRMSVAPLRGGRPVAETSPTPFNHPSGSRT